MAAVTAPTAICPPWCSGGCAADASDGSVMHMSVPVVLGIVTGNALLDVALFRLDYPEDGRQGEATVDVAIGNDQVGELTPVKALELMEVLRDHALRGAGPEGVEMSVERVRIGDELLTPDGWQTVEIVDVDGWLIEGHPSAVGVNTDAHAEDEQAYRFAIGTPARVRRAVTA